MATDQSGKPMLIPGTLELLVLRTLLLGRLHGYGIAQHIHRMSKDALVVEEGSLYPALNRMRARGWITAEWDVSHTGRRARYYRLTPVGRKALKAELEAYNRLTSAIDLVLGGI